MRAITDLAASARSGRRSVAVDDPESRVESNMGLLGIGGTGCRVTSQVFRDDPRPLGFGTSFGFDLDADERVPAGPQYQYTLVRDTGGIPAAGIFAFSQVIARRLLQSPMGNGLDPTAVRFQETLRTITQTGLYNVTLPVFGAGGGVGHGLLRAILDHHPRRKTLMAPVAVFPGQKQNLGIRLSACAAVGKWFRPREGADPSLMIMVENDRLEQHAGVRTRWRNQRLVRALQIMAASHELSFQAGTAGGNIDRALLGLVPRRGPAIATLGSACRTARGDGLASLHLAVQDALDDVLAHERNPMADHSRRAIIFATIPKRMHIEEAKRVLEDSPWNNASRGYELVGKFLGPAGSSTIDVAVLVTGDFMPRLLAQELHTLPRARLDEMVEERLAAAQAKLRSITSVEGRGSDPDVDAVMESARADIHAGLDVLQGVSP